jgi:hypothetical protein
MKYIKTFESIKPIKPITYYKNGKYHREYGPAYQSWYDNGQKRSEQYFINGKLHREDGSAYQHWYGQKWLEAYYKNGNRHREDGPAHQYWYENGQKDIETYFINGIEYTREKWIEKLKEINSPHYEDELTKYEGENYNL